MCHLFISNIGSLHKVASSYSDGVDIKEVFQTICCNLMHLYELNSLAGISSQLINYFKLSNFADSIIIFSLTHGSGSLIDNLKLTLIITLKLYGLHLIFLSAIEKCL